MSRNNGSRLTFEHPRCAGCGGVMPEGWRLVAVASGIISLGTIKMGMQAADACCSALCLARRLIFVAQATQATAVKEMQRHAAETPELPAPDADGDVLPGPGHADGEVPSDPDQ